MSLYTDWLEEVDNASEKYGYGLSAYLEVQKYYYSDTLYTWWFHGWSPDEAAKEFGKELALGEN